MNYAIFRSKPIKSTNALAGIGAHDNREKEKYYKLMKDHFYIDGIIERPLIKNNELVDRVIMIPKSFVSIEELKA